MNTVVTERLDRSIDVLVRRHMATRPGEQVLVTCDDASDAVLVDGLIACIRDVGAEPSLLRLDRLPLQGLLADPFIPASLGRAAASCDVWLDLTFPYLAGSTPFAVAMESGRARYVLLGDLGSAGVTRLYDAVAYDALFDLQEEADRLLCEAEGESARITTPRGTDIEFVVGRPATRKSRSATSPGAQTVPGSAIFYPEVETVRGTIVLEAAFHDRYERLREPIAIEVDGRIVRVGPGAQREPLERALHRAGGGGYGHVIHLTLGLHAAAVDRGVSFIEDIRALGRNAIGLGLPWWVPGGGENHPDGVVSAQSVLIAGEAILVDGRPAPGGRLEPLLRAVEATMIPSARGVAAGKDGP